jgi:hypothetical protein
MSMDQEKAWSAYLDGEMSTPEASAFESSLAERGYRRLEAEMKLEAGMAETLCTGGDCPDAVWDRTREMLQAQMKATSGHGILWDRRVLALAASILVCVGAAWAYYAYTGTPSFMVVPASARELAARTESEPIWENAETYLHDHNIQLALRPLESDTLDVHDSLEFLGATHVRYHGEEVVELLFDCCSKPIVLAVAPRHSHVASMMTEAVGGGNVQGTQVVGDYVVAVVAKHRANGLMNVFAEI